MAYANAPLPPAQQHQYPAQYAQPSSRPQPHASFNYQDPASRPRAQTNVSHHSKKSSTGGIAQETHEEKDRNRLHTKADPSVAMNEAQPADVAAQQATSMAPIRAIQHKDNQGNPIADPDRSNPTRSRWERPLDTIRAFEAAIDGNSQASDVDGRYSRRSSYYEASPRQNANQFNRYQSPRPESYVGSRRDSNYGAYSQHTPGFQNSQHAPGPQYSHGPSGGYDYGGAGHGSQPNNYYAPNRDRVPRAAESFTPQQGGYPSPGRQQSYDNVGSASGSASSADPAGYQTDPSSENSSVDQRIAPTHMLSGTQGQASYGSSPGAYGDGGYPTQQQAPYNAAQRMGDGYFGANSAHAQRGVVPPRVPIKLGSTTATTPPATQPTSRPSLGEKRKSWFGRRFSKS